MSEALQGSSTVLAAPEFGTKRVLRPFKGFEAIYQGQDVRKPICFCENNEPYDPLAKRGLPGYDPNLVYGIPGNLGVRASIDIPMVAWSKDGTLTRYWWMLQWRLRNIRDHNLNSDKRVPWHVAKSGVGFPETGTNPGPRVPIYGIVETAVFAQSEPTGFPPPLASVVLRQVVVEPVGNFSLAPLMPDGSNGAVQQGIRPTIAFDLHTAPFYVNYETQAIGDDLVIAVRRDADDDYPNWDFTPGGPDNTFSDFFGNGTGFEYEDLGVLLSWGVSP
jgi:hypothetical protein